MTAQVDSDSINFDEELKSFESPAHHIGSIDFDPTNNALMCGFSEIERGRYLRHGKSDLFVLAARPGVGKTQLALQICANVARSGSALFFSLEMDRRQLKQRLYSSESDTPLNRLHLLSENKRATIDARFNSCNLYVDDTNGLEINNLMSRTIAFNKFKKLDLIAVDYLQIVGTQGSRSKAEEVGQVAEKLKTLAKEVGCPVLALAQMNRNVESRLVHNKRDSRPMMSDLADSSNIEKFADQVVFLHRQYTVNKERPGEADVFVSKNRHGAVGDFKLGFSHELAKFYDYVEQQEGL